MNDTILYISYPHIGTILSYIKVILDKLQGNSTHMLKTAQNKGKSNVGIWRSVLMLQASNGGRDSRSTQPQRGQAVGEGCPLWVPGLPVSFWNACRLLTVPDKNILSLFDHLAYNQKSIQRAKLQLNCFSLYLQDVCLFGLLEYDQEKIYCYWYPFVPF